MQSRVFAGLATLMLTSLASLASAQTYATNVEHVAQGPHWTGGPVAPIRSNPLAALGAPNGPAEGTYFSLGFGGSITLSFGTDFTGPITVWEVTTGTIANHPEHADVFVGWGTDAQTATFWHVANLFNLNPAAPISLDSTNLISGRTVYNFVKIVDTSNKLNLPSNSDGFDVDAVSVIPIPAPASLALLGAAALTAARRRRA